MIRNERRVLALGSIIVALTAMLGTAPAHAQAEPPIPIPPGEYVYRGTWCHTLSWPGYYWEGCGGGASKLVADAPIGSTQRRTVRNDCRDNVYETTVDYQPDGIHLVRSYRDSGERPWSDDPANCGNGVALPELCNPIPAPLILPTGAEPGQHLSYTMACVRPSVHQVAIDIVGWKKVMISGKWTTTLVIRTRQVITSAVGTFVYSGEDWVIPHNGLHVFNKSRLFSDNLFVIMTGIWNMKSALSTCSTCPDTRLQPPD